MAPNDPRKAAQDKLAREKKEQLQRQNSQQRIIASKYNHATNYIKTDSKWQNTYLPVIPRLNPDGTFKES
ncbi:unnamed protein product [Oikopleura dioica]|uniref:Uncharacterized protein n=1 Tax=Oikopleura dioica TaxID=34765 RepID=E4Z5A4_OIKDI|nr:unnamed protein product [Oikopleura dioica]